MKGNKIKVGKGYSSKLGNKEEWIDDGPDGR